MRILLSEGSGLTSRQVAGQLGSLGHTVEILLQLASWPSGASISLGEAGTFANFWQAHSLCHRALCSISILPTFRCLCWGRLLSKHLRSAVSAPSSISSSSWSVSILASLGSRGLKRTAFRQPNETLNAIEAANLNPDLDRALAYLISVGIAAFGVWIVAHTIGSNASLGLDALGYSARPSWLDQPLSRGQTSLAGHAAGFGDRMKKAAK
jgi:hypothetical protein